MLKAERARIIMNELDKIYPETPIPLDHKDAYTLLIAVLLSAQCTDIRVNEVTPALFRLADNPKDMSTKDVAEIQAIIRPCGLSGQKAKAIRRLSEMLCELHRETVPQTYEELEALPGVGHKTASVVMSQGFGFPAFPVDTHIQRLAVQWKLTTGNNVVRTERDLKKVFPKDRWNKLHLQIIFYGREYSPARGKGKFPDFITPMLFPPRMKG